VALRHLLPDAYPILKGADRDEGLGVELELPMAFGEVVKDRHIVPPSGKIHGGRPAQITVAPQDQDSHAGLLKRSRTSLHI
jgi:hypothetical protein